MLILPLSLNTQRFASFRFSKRSSPKKMDRLRRSFRDSFRRRKDRVPESTKPLQWPTDEQAVRSSTCSFPVKYLGCIEVYESRGMHICEEAIKMLRVSIMQFFIVVKWYNIKLMILLFYCDNRIRDDGQFAVCFMSAVTDCVSLMTIQRV